MQRQSYKIVRHEFDAKGGSSQDLSYGRTNFASSSLFARSSRDITTENRPTTYWSNVTYKSQGSGARTSSIMPNSVWRQEEETFANVVPPATGEHHLMQESQQDHTGLSNVCNLSSYTEPHFGNSLPDNSPGLIHKDLWGAPNPATFLPFVSPEEPVYVNAKQYHGIMRRRQSRAKAELENKVSKARKITCTSCMGRCYFCGIFSTVDGVEIRGGIYKPAEVCDANKFLCFCYY